MGHEFMQVFGEGVVVVPRCRLAGLAKASAVIGDDTVTSFQKNWHLLLPRSAVEWIPVDQHDRLARPVVLIIEFDVARVFFADSNKRHLSLLSVVWSWVGCGRFASNFQRLDVRGQPADAMYFLKNRIIGSLKNDNLIWPERCSPACAMRGSYSQ